VDVHATLLTVEEGLARAQDGAVALERPELAAIEVTGADVLRYLHAVSSQHTADLVPGDAAEALLLSPKGRIELAFRLAVTPGGVLLDTEAEAAPALAERLARFVFRHDVTVGGPSPGGASVLGPEARAALAAAGLPPLPEPGHAGAAGLPLVVHRGAGGAELVGVEAPAALAALAAAGVPVAPAEVAELVRVALGVPRWGRELGDDVLAEEAGLLGSHVHLDKGCYPGQETVARVHNLGQVQRRLAGLRFRGRDLPPPRADLVAADGRRAGQLRSAVRHPRLGPIGLAYLRRFVEPGALVSAGTATAEVVALPFEPR
jgi:tRNA-modifying protein YgfZ